MNRSTTSADKICTRAFDSAVFSMEKLRLAPGHIHISQPFILFATYEWT